MAWQNVSTGDTIEADHINDIHDALSGVVGKGKPMAFTEVDDDGTYALDVRQKDTGNGLIARFRNGMNELLLEIIQNRLRTAKQIVSDVDDGTAPLVVASKTRVNNLNADQVDGHDAGNGPGNVLLLDQDGYVPLENLSGIDAGNLADNAVGNAQFRQSAGLSVVGRADENDGNVDDIVADKDDSILARVSGALQWVKLTLGMIPDKLITGAKLANKTVERGNIADKAIGTDQIDEQAVTAAKLNQGAGSGIDADLLDGNHASAFATSGHTHKGLYVPLYPTGKPVDNRANYPVGDHDITVTGYGVPSNVSAVHVWICARWGTTSIDYYMHARRYGTNEIYGTVNSQSGGVWDAATCFVPVANNRIRIHVDGGPPTRAYVHILGYVT